MFCISRWPLCYSVDVVFRIIKSKNVKCVFFVSFAKALFYYYFWSNQIVFTITCIYKITRKKNQIDNFISYLIFSCYLVGWRLVQLSRRYCLLVFWPNKLKICDAEITPCRVPFFMYFYFRFMRFFCRRW